MGNLYAADFENDISNMHSTHVWGAGIVDIYSTDVKIFENIDDWFNYVKELPTQSIIYFHNLNYDVNFILSHLNKLGYHQCESNQRSGKPKDKDGYSIVASSEGSFYELAINFGKNYVKIRDSLKLMNGKLAKIAKDLQIEEKYWKLEGTVDYSLPRPLPYHMTDIERKYLYNDCMALAKILIKLEEMGLTKKLTAAGFALDQFKTIFFKQDNPNADETNPLFFKDKRNHYRRYFPVLPAEVDTFCRKSYKGGFCFCNTDESIKNKELYVYDVNSMYPAQMLGVTDANGKKWGGVFPVGMPEYFEKEIPDCDLYIVHIDASFVIKPNHIPFIQLKNSSEFMPNLYITDSEGHQELWLTSVDYELFHEQYDVLDEEIIDGYMFCTRDDIFKDYINKFYAMKDKGKREKNGSMTALAKICLNSCYGKFGTRPHMPNPHIVFDEDNLMHIQTLDNDVSDNEGEYVPVACFTTAYARSYIVRSAQANYKHFLYSDTDSLHMDAPAKNIWIDKYSLGAWDCESEDDPIVQGRYIRQKTYVEKHKSGKWDIRACGMPEQCKQKLLDEYGDGLIDIFHKGFEIDGKLARKRVEGGVILFETTFAIKCK